VGYDAISPSITGLVLFDMLNYAVKEGSAEDRRRLEPVVTNCVRLRSVARETGIAVIYPKADHRPDGRDIGARYSDVGHDMQPWADPEIRLRPHKSNTAGSWGAEVIDELAPEPGDYLIPKHRWSALFQTKMELSLRSRGICVLLLCGGATEIGIASTAYAARDLDFDLVVVSDACTSSKADVHETFMHGVFPRFARVRTTDQVIEMIEAGTLDSAAQV